MQFRITRTRSPRQTVEFLTGTYSPDRAGGGTQYRWTPYSEFAKEYKTRGGAERMLAKAEAANAHRTTTFTFAVVEVPDTTPAEEFLYGCQNYLSLSDELSDPTMTLDDLDTRFVDEARTFAADLGVPFPIDDVDIALDHVQAACRRSAN